MREEITAILSLATPEDEVLVRLENAGGLVHEHGLAASQLLRIREHDIPLTIAVDKVAASGGYMMACVANRIIAAPFAILGSIGVLAQLPNFNRLLKKNGIDFEMIKAGELKRTLTLFGTNTDQDRARFKEQIEDTHALFKDFVSENRPSLDLDKVATGEHWYGRRALDLKLIDELKTSDDYLLSANAETDIYEITYTAGKRISEKLASALQHASDRILLSWWQRSREEHFFS
jgi:serine protease SohB